MAKLSRLDKAIANMCAKRVLMDAVIEELEALKTPPAKKPSAVFGKCASSDPCWTIGRHHE